MVNETTLMANLVDPEVLDEMLEEKLSAGLKLIPIAKVNTKLQGIPGDTLTIPKWNMIGEAEDIPEDAYIDAEKLSKDTIQLTIKKIGKSVTLSQEAINSGFGDPEGGAVRQLGKAVLQKLQRDILNALYSGSVFYDGTSGVIGYTGVVGAVATFLDEEDGVDKVMYIHPKQQKTLLLDRMFTSADSFEAGVAVKGAIGMIDGTYIKKSKDVRFVEYEKAEKGSIVVVPDEEEAKEGTIRLSDARSACASHLVVGDTVNKLDTGFWLNPIVKVEIDSEETEYNDADLPAVTLLMKKAAQLDREWVPRKQHHEYTIAEYYGAALTNESKVVLAKFAGDEPKKVVKTTKATTATADKAATTATADKAAATADKAETADAKATTEAKEA